MSACVGKVRRSDCKVKAWNRSFLFSWQWRQLRGTAVIFCWVDHLKTCISWPAGFSTLVPKKALKLILGLFVPLLRSGSVQVFIRPNWCSITRNVDARTTPPPLQHKSTPCKTQHWRNKPQQSPLSTIPEKWFSRPKNHFFFRAVCQAIDSGKRLRPQQTNRRF